MSFSPSDRLSGEPDLLSLSGQTMSQKLKSPRIWAEGSPFEGREDMLVAVQKPPI